MQVLGVRNTRTPRRNPWPRNGRGAGRSAGSLLLHSGYALTSQETPAPNNPEFTETNLHYHFTFFISLFKFDSIFNRSLIFNFR